MVINEKSEKQSSYASYVDGLIGVKPRCPEHEEVELAIDTDGRLHMYLLMLKIFVTLQLFRVGLCDVMVI